MEKGPRHKCMIYTGNPALQLPTLASVMRSNMSNGYRCLYMNNATMVAGIQSALTAIGVDVAEAVAETSLVLSSESVLDGDEFNVDQMLQLLEDELDQALKDGYKGLWASGDISWEFGTEKNFDKLLEYEWQLEELFKKRKELSGICQYHYDTLSQQSVRRGLLAHRTVFINETLSRLNPYYVYSAQPSEKTGDSLLLDNMIAELCQSNAETIRNAN
jgi:hypothetical protein